MDRERWQRLKGILDQALEREGDERHVFVEEYCARHPEVAEELRSLVRAADAVENQATRSALGVTRPAAPRPSSSTPGSIGPYRILSRLGEGGMGVVFEAQQANPKRRVAVKIVRGGQFVDDKRLRLFQREAETLARLRHPGIGAIYESGRTDDGQHFFAMELVRGLTLDKYIARRPKVVNPGELRFRLALFRKIADAVHYAHQRGVIHRDLKPSNIVVTEDTLSASGPDQASAPSDAGLPEIKILDFGLARITEGDVTAATMTTEIGVIKGTLAYMSPEQARGMPAEIDLRSDVYSLGVILYEMLSGSRPYDVSGKSIADSLRAICEEPPRPLSQSWSGTKRLNIDVETIVGRALDKDPSRRYASAASLSEDVARYLSSQPILARPPSTIYQLRKFAARNKALVGGIVATFVVLLAGVAVATVLGLKEARQRLEAQVARDEAEKAGYQANLVAAEAGLRLFDLAEVKRRLAACPPPLRGWEWEHLAFRSDMCERVIQAHSWRIYAADLSPDGRLVASAAVDPDNTIRLWDAKTGNRVRELEGHPATAGARGGIRAVAFSPDSSMLVSASDDATLRLWDVTTGEKLRELTGHERGVLDVEFTADGGEVISASSDATIRRWNAATGEPLGIIGRHGNRPTLAICKPTRIVSASLDKTIRVWKRNGGGELRRVELPERIMNLACSPGRTHLAAALADGTIRIIDLETGEELQGWKGHDDWVFAITYSPDGTRLVSAGRDRTVRLWDAGNSELLSTLVGHDDYVNVVRVTPDGETIVSGSADRTLRLWSTDPADTTRTFAREASGIDRLVVTVDGRVATFSRANGFRVRDGRDGRLLASIEVGGEGAYQAVAISRDGRRFAACRSNNLYVFELDDSGDAKLVSHEAVEDVRALEFIPGRDEILVGEDRGGRVIRRDVRTGRVLAEYPVSESYVVATGTRADGRRMLASVRGGLALVDLDTGEVLARTETVHIDSASAGGSPAQAIAFSPDGRRIATAHAQDYTVRLWNAETLESIATRPGHTERPRAIAFSPDGSRIASASVDYSVRLWDGVTGEPLLALRNDRMASVSDVDFAPDGSDIFSCDSQGVITRWRGKTDRAGPSKSATGE